MTSDRDVTDPEVDETEVDEALDAVVLDELLDADVDELLDSVVDVNVAVVYIHNSTVGVCTQSTTTVPFTPWSAIVSWIVDVRLVVSFISESRTLSTTPVSVPSTSTL